MFLLRVIAVCVVALLAAQLGAGQDSYKGKTLESVPFEKRAFKKGADFSETKLTKCNFSEAKLVEADFRKATITSGYFLWADLAKSDFRGAKLTKDVSFGGAILNSANLGGLDLSECGFNVTKFRGANLRHLKGIKSVSRCDFTDADLRGADLSGMKWVAADAQPKFTNAQYDSKTVWPAAIDPTTVGAKLVKDADPPKDQPTPPDVTKLNPDPKTETPPKDGEKQLELAGTYWQLLSLTAKGEKPTDATNPAEVEFTKGGKWGILHYGGARIAGTYKIKDGRLVMIDDDKAPFMDAKMTWKPATNMLELDDGKNLMRLKRVELK
ncbi:MAG: pentapeptide repeat-containing protein [Gemmataceae bacterium]